MFGIRKKKMKCKGNHLYEVTKGAIAERNKIEEDLKKKKQKEKHEKDKF